MHHVKRVLCSLILVAVAIAPDIRADGMVKPRIRAITGFITIDAKSYTSQIQEAVTFLSQVRDAVKAAGYDVAGIRISTQPFPQYTRDLKRADAMALLRGINDLATTLPSIGRPSGRRRASSRRWASAVLTDKATSTSARPRC